MKRAGTAHGLAITALALALNGCSEYNREAIDSNNQGMQLLRANRYADAREKFQRAAEEDRRFDQPLYNLALSYIRQKDWSNSIDALQRAIARNNNNAEYHYLLGYAHYQIATAPENAENAEGGAHFEQARTAFAAALQKNRGLYMAQYLTGKIAEALDEPQDAMRAYTETLRIAPRAYMAYVRLANLYYQHRLYPQAEQVIRAGLQVSTQGVSERGQMHNVLGLTLEARDQKPQAVEEFRAAIAEDPQLTAALYSLGTLYEDLGQRPQAILYLQQFVAAQGGGNADYLADAQARLARLQTPSTP